MQIVVGYIDNEGFSYCLKHGSRNMEVIYSNNNENDTCSICGECLDVRINTAQSD